jgi:hypothetical protein
LVSNPIFPFNGTARLECDDATTSHLRHGCLRSRSGALPLCKRADTTLCGTLEVSLLLLLLTLQHPLCLLSKLVLGELQDFLLALLCDGAGLLLHLQLHVARCGFLLGLELLQGEEVYQLLILLVHLHELLRVVPVCVYAVLDLRVYTLIHRHIGYPYLLNSSS